MDTTVQIHGWYRVLTKSIQSWLRSAVNQLRRQSVSTLYILYLITYLLPPLHFQFARDAKCWWLRGMCFIVALEAPKWRSFVWEDIQQQLHSTTVCVCFVCVCVCVECCLNSVTKTYWTMAVVDEADLSWKSLKCFACSLHVLCMFSACSLRVRVELRVSSIHSNNVETSWGTRSVVEPQKKTAKSTPSGAHVWCGISSDRLYLGPRVEHHQPWEI